LKNKKYFFTDLSNDEISKKHLKFMHGGRGPQLEGEFTEEVYSVDFPKNQEPYSIF
jgi:hypothetical protein